MTHLDLDAQPEAIRQFVLTLAAEPGGVLLKSSGRPVACVVPSPRAPASATEPWTDEKNRRRCELIDRKYDSGLEPAEEAELVLLQDEMQRHVDLVAPLPLDEARRLHQELLRKATARAADGADV